MTIRGRVLFIMSEASQITGTDGQIRPTGYWFSEFAVPYRILTAEGWAVDIATPCGSRPVPDPASLGDVSDPCSLSGINNGTDWEPEYRFITEQAEILSLRQMSDKSFSEYCGVFFPGGYAPVVDLCCCRLTALALSHFHHTDKPTALFCHAPAALLSTCLLENYLYKDYEMACFTDSEEQSSETGRTVPFSVAQSLENAGSRILRTEDWKAFVITCHELITGQNTASAAMIAETFLNELDNRSHV